MPSILANTDHELLTPTELADLLRIKVGTLYTWRHRGEGPPVVKVGGALRYPRSGVEEWIATEVMGASTGGTGDATA